MSENKINSDSKDPLREDNSSNIPDNESVPEKVSEQGSPPEDQSKADKFPTDPDAPAREDAHIVDSKDDSEANEKIISEETEGVSGNSDETIIEKETIKDPIKDVIDEQVKTADVPEDPIPVPVSKPLVAKSKESNYQISLINENLLKILVTARKRGVKIDSVVKENKSSQETQTNEIYFYPKFDLSLQEVEVLISIEESQPDTKDIKDIKEEISTTGEEQVTDQEEAAESTKSNYQINLINENLLNIKILTGNAVRIDSLARDKKNSLQTQSNKIYLKEKAGSELQEIEIKINIEEEGKESKDAFSGIEEGKVKLIPNPEVVDLIQPPDYSSLLNDPYSVDYQGSSYKNPFDSLRELIRKNLTIGLIAAVILHLAAAGFAYYKLSKKEKDQQPEEQSRLIVIQDLPDPKIKLEDVEDPNKPKITEPVKEPETIEREIPPRKIVKPPIVTRPKRDTENEEKLDSSLDNLNSRLDSLRKLTEEEQFLDSNLTSNDTTKATDTSASFYEIPDSLKTDFNENDIGLAMYFPKNWKLTDQRELNKNEKEFKGVVIADTTAEQPGTMTMFIFLDNEKKDYNAEDFKTEFVMNDSNLTAFFREPKTTAGFTEYWFYIFNNIGIEKLSLKASVRKQFFDQYKNEIEAVVRSIKIKKKDDLN